MFSTKKFLLRVGTVVLWLLSACTMGIETKYKGELMAKLPGLLASDRWYVKKLKKYVEEHS